MQEYIQRFGKHKNLYGILTQPNNTNNKPCIMIINAGSVHKAGPFGLHVDLARYFANKGYTCFRFDLSGQGESAKLPTELTRSQQIVEDMEGALDCLEQQHQQTDVIAFGLCTGAENAHKIAVQDKRIKGVIWLDGYAYITPKFHRTRLISKLLKPTTLVKSIYKRLFVKVTTTKPQNNVALSSDEDSFVWKLPEINSYRHDMSILAANNTQCLYIYSGGAHAYYNHQGQLVDAFANETFTSQIEEVFFPKASHTFFVLTDKQVLMACIENWLFKRF
ncbi:MAG: dienelactone hydrolase [Pseudohongiellaceae bacterium]|jgi:dienelactone hydrolase